MVKTKGFKELEGARRWAHRILEGGTITLGKNKSVEVLEIGILAKDKRRTDWIEATIQKRPIHWGWPDVDTTRRFGLQLRAFGVPIPAKGMLLLGQV